MRDYYTEKVVLVTGGAVGLGLELCRQLVNMKANVVIASRSKNKLDQAKQAIGSESSRVLFCQADVRLEEDLNTLRKQILERFGRIDLLINNAALSAMGNVRDMDISVFKDVIDTNLVGSIRCTKTFIDDLTKTKGGIFFISSIASFIGLPSYSAYSASKSALFCFAEALSIELSKDGVYVGVAHLGFVRNDADKVFMDASGSEQVVPRRNEILIIEKAAVANAVLKQIARKKFSKLIGPFSGTYLFLVRNFKGLVKRLIGWKLG